MKIALIAFRFGPSHGSILQTYALFSTLKAMGHEVVIMNRQIATSWKKDLRSLLRRNILKILGRYKGPVFFKGSYPKRTMREMNKFVETELSSHLVTFTKESIEKFLPGKYDAYIVGSDQTWRPKYVEDVRYYYLDFLGEEKVKRIAYAPSFGVDEWEYDILLTESCKKLAKKFTAISVREKSGVELCNKHLGVKADFVLDPVFLLKKEDYEKFFKSKGKEKNILAYSLLDRDFNKEKIIETLASRSHLKTIRINGDVNHLQPSIEHWLYYISQADLVVTDSFHATAFSILFNTPFIVISNNVRGRARIDSLLSLFGLQDRLWNNDNDYSKQVLNPIDWSHVNNILEEYRERSKDFLMRALLQD